MVTTQIKQQEKNYLKNLHDQSSFFSTFDRSMWRRVKVQQRNVANLCF